LPAPQVPLIILTELLRNRLKADTLGNMVFWVRAGPAAACRLTRQLCAAALLCGTSLPPAVPTALNPRNHLSQASFTVLGQPMCLIMYYHDWLLANTGEQVCVGAEGEGRKGAG
jgi:hypothetical protein